MRRGWLSFRKGVVALVCLGVASVLLSLCPSVAYADVDGGTYAGVPWVIKDDYALLIGTDGATTEFTERPQSQTASDWPWNLYSTYITSITFLGTVKGNGCHDYMFMDCEKANPIDLSGFDTSNVNRMGHMFDNCTSLTSVNLSGLNTSSVTGMEAMFYGCTSLTSVDLSSFDVSHIDVGTPGFNFNDMFFGCTSLTSVDLTGWSPPADADITRMFSGCTSLRSVDLTPFSPIHTENFMLEGATALTSITLGTGSAPLSQTRFTSAYTWSKDMVSAYTGDEMRTDGGLGPGTYYAVRKISFDAGDGSGTASPVYTPIDTQSSYVLPDVPASLTAPTGKEFDAWDLGEVGATVAITGDTTLTATWKYRSYTITWDVDGTKTSTSHTYGTTPSFSGSTSKTPDDQYHYAFARWSPTVTTVTGDATYTALYNRTAHGWGSPSWTWNQALTSATVELTCSSCGHQLSKSATVTNAQTLAPTCTTAGRRTYTATADVNGTDYTDTRTKSISALGHDFTDDWHADAEGHWHECSRCQARDAAQSHVSGGPATEQSPETCTVCGYVISPEIGHVHADHLTYVAEAAPTCTDAGNVAYYLCSCGKLFWDQSATDEIANASDVQTAALGHSFSSAWQSDAGGHWHACMRCQAADDVRPHNSSGAATVERAERCNTCGYEINPMRVVISRVVFRNTGETTLEPLSFRQMRESERTWTMTLPASEPKNSGNFFESWSCSAKDGTFKPGESFTFNYADASEVVFTAQWTPLIGAGAYDLEAGRYRLEVGVHKVEGDATTYADNQYVYVPDANHYTFS